MATTVNTNNNINNDNVKQVMNDLLAKYNGGNTMTKLFQEGVRSGNYLVKLINVKEGTTRAGDPIVRFVYEIDEPYEFDDDTLTNVRITTTFTNGIKQDTEGNDVNYAVDQLKLAIYDVVTSMMKQNMEVKQEEVKVLESDSVPELIEGLHNLLNKADNANISRSQEAYVKTTKMPSINGGNDAIFYAVYVDRQ